MYLRVFELISFLLGSDLELSIHADKVYLLHLDSSALCLEKLPHYPFIGALK